MTDIKVPKLGEGTSAGTVVSILVKEGEAVRKDQTVLELETDKAVAPIPAPAAGTVARILVKEGQSVGVGQTVISLSGGAASASTPAPAAPAAPAPAPRPSAPAPAPAVPVYAAPAAEGYTYTSPTGAEPPASPSLRQLAKELGIDLRHVRGSEYGGRIVMADLRAYIQALQSRADRGQGTPAAAPSAAPAKPAAESIDFSKWGPVTRKQPSQLRKVIGQRMSEAWNAIPHVTQFDEADITDLMELRKKYVPFYEKKKASLTLTGMMLKTVCAVLKKYPVFNSSLDEATGEIVYKDYIHLGIAVDTEAGLIVPVIRDADKKSILELSLELGALAEKTRQRKVGVDDLQGGSFTISNLGGIGGHYFTPIVNRPQTAILGVSRGVMKPVVKMPVAKGKTKTAPKIEARLMMPLALSYDHRVIDGADGARFMRELAHGLENFNENDLKI